MRYSDIPAGKSIFIPLLVGECEYSTPEIKSDDDLRRCATAGMNMVLSKLLLMVLN
jgi:hypothetical protein